MIQNSDAKWTYQGSTLLLVQSKALDEAPYKLSRAVAKLAGITF
jgi:hypothetical protein